jgi:hypothetical protein
MIRAAVEHARRHGAGVVEAYPTLPRERELPPVSSFMGIPQAFLGEGFVEAARPSASRVILRRVIAASAAR